MEIDNHKSQLSISKETINELMWIKQKNKIKVKFHNNPYHK